MIPMLVMISCMYGQGCNETSHTYLASDLQLQENLKYTESLVNSTFNPNFLVASGLLMTAMSGGDVQTPLTSYLNLKGNIRCQCAGLAYHYSF